MIKLRPHHVMCNYCFMGSGYSSDFVDNFTQINHDIINNGAQFQIANKLDSICSACPNQNGVKCESQDKVEQLDIKHSQALDLKNDAILDWQMSVNKIRDNITPEVFAEICHECEWYSLGICYNKLFQ